MKLKVFLIVALLICSVTFAEKSWVESYMDYFTQAQKALKDKDYKSALVCFQKQLELIPTRGRTYYNIALMQAFLKNEKEAAEHLTKALNLGFDIGKDLNKNLSFINENEEFSDVRKLIEKVSEPINNSKTAFVIPQKDLIPEGIAYDSEEKAFYLGSIYRRKILKISKDGTVSDFTKDNQDGLQEVLGMKVDAKRRNLWVASEISVQAHEDIKKEDIGWSGIFKYDLKTGKLIKKYTIHKPGVKHLFNDVAFTSKGDLFVTDSEFGAIYHIPSKTDKLELFIKSKEFFYPNGISIGKDDNTLFMAAFGGVYKINISTKKYKLLDHPKTISLNGIDGMYYYNNSLVCIQNGLSRVSRFYLKDENTRAEKVEIIEKGNPHFIIPTTGTIADNKLYYIANAQLRALKPDGKLIPEDQRKEIVILVTDLVKDQ